MYMLISPVLALGHVRIPFNRVIKCIFHTRYSSGRNSGNAPKRLVLFHMWSRKKYFFSIKEEHNHLTMSSSLWSFCLHPYQTWPFLLIPSCLQLHWLLSLPFLSRMAIIPTLAPPASFSTLPSHWIALAFNCEIILGKRGWKIGSEFPYVIRLDALLLISQGLQQFLKSLYCCVNHIYLWAKIPAD